jgi:hypothetical protein
MKKCVIWVLFLMSGLGVAQKTPDESPFQTQVSPANANVTEKLIPVSRSDVYCAGFITKQPVSKESFVAAGLGTPQQTRYADRDFIFVKGSNLQPGKLVSIVREVRNPDRVQAYQGTDKLLNEAGQPYFDIGYARITELRAEVAVAQVEFVCQPIVPGDLAVPFIERPAIVARESSTLDRFPAEKPSLAGKIVLAENFDQFVSAGRKVFINIGWEKGVKCGEYYRVTRTYSPKEYDGSDAAAFSTVVTEDTQKDPQHLRSGKKFTELPRRTVGEIIILNATPTSATGMITFALEEIHAGDAVELEQTETAEPVPTTASK